MHHSLSHSIIVRHEDPNIIFELLAFILVVLRSRCFSILVYARNRGGFIRAFIWSILGHRCQRRDIILIGLKNLFLIGGFVSVHGIRKAIDLFWFLDHLDVHLRKYF